MSGTSSKKKLLTSNQEALVTDVSAARTSLAPRWWIQQQHDSKSGTSDGIAAFKREITVVPL